jgi:hypothetical protein
MQDHLKLLGFRVRDVVTGFEGVVESISFDLYGCVQAIVRPVVDEKGQAAEPRWCDLKRLTATSDAPVMPVPTFVVVPGGAEKPAYPSTPLR